MANTVAVVVAHVDIIGHIELEARAPQLLQLAPGDHLQVKLLFNFVELSRKHDDFELKLNSEFAGQTAKPAVHTHKDRRGLSDDQQGFIMQAYTVPQETGEYLLSFEARVEYTEDGEREQVYLDDQVMVQVA